MLMGVTACSILLFLRVRSEDGSRVLGTSRAEHQNQAEPGIEPALPWQCLRGNFAARKINITGCLAK